MSRTSAALAATVSALIPTALGAQSGPSTLRPPAVPLIACDPYFSIWSCADRLTDEWPRHWTGRPNALCGLIRVDGAPFRLIGPEPKPVPAMPQVSVDVLPTRTLYAFEGAGVRVGLTFMTAMLPEDLDVLARPVTYVTFDVTPTDGRGHEVALYYDHSAEIAVNDASQPVIWAREDVRGLDVLRIGSAEQPVLEKKGDDLRIDWGYLYLATDKSRASRQVIAAAHLIVAYDDLYSIEYFGRQLRPYWRRDGDDAADLLRDAAHDYDELCERCAEFDEELMSNLQAAGGTKYARLAALAYRQAIAGCKLAADGNGMPVFFPKECFSNGCIGTVDVIYPMQPLFIFLSPALAKASLAPVLEYAASGRWRFPFAPHDLGTYPKANGQVYGGGERTEENQMPVEESGNMLLMLAALAKAEGSAEFAGRYWEQLTDWADYLAQKGFDPENQLCTDDFAGHLAHNANLSIKAILGLGAYAQLCAMRGEEDAARKYLAMAHGFASQWVDAARDDDHYRLAFDRPGTWSQKYNLVWDRILGLGLFPADVARTEIAYYRNVQNRYGIPLDNRSDYTKTDWVLWTATLTQESADFEALLGPVFDFLNDTPDRVPMTDWYFTSTAKRTGFQARPVVGGVFLRMLYEDDAWRKWAKRADKAHGRWAPVP